MTRLGSVFYQDSRRSARSFQKQQRHHVGPAPFHDKMDVMLLERFRMGLTTLMKSGKQAATGSELDKMSEARRLPCPADAIGIDKNLLAELKNNMAIMLPRPALEPQRMESMRSEWNHCASRVLRATVPCRSWQRCAKTRELAEAQGAIMAVLQEQREHQVQMLNTTFNRVQGSGGGSQSSYAQQKQPVTGSAKPKGCARVDAAILTVPDND